MSVIFPRKKIASVLKGSCAVFIVFIMYACPRPSGPHVLPPPIIDGTTLTPKEPIEIDPHTDETAKKLYQNLQSAKTAGDQQAQEKYSQELLRLYSMTESAAMVRFQLAQDYKQQGDLEKAIVRLSEVLINNPTFSDIQKVRYMLVELLIETGRFQDVAPLLSSALDNEKDPAVIAHWRPVLIDSLMKIGHGEAALRQLVELYQQTTDQDAHKDYAERILKAVDGSLGVIAVRKMYEELKSDREYEFPFALIGFKLAKVLYHMRDFEGAKLVVQELENYAPTDPWTDRSKEVTTILEERMKTDPHKIGVILPLSGRYKLYGESALNAIRIALQKYPELVIHVRDSKSNPLEASRAVEDLVLNEHVLCIVGPMFRKTSHAAALKADDLETPIILLAYAQGLPQLGKFIFRYALTPEQQAQALVEVAFEKLGYSNFAVLYPESSFGRSMMQSFWDEVVERKGQIRAVEGYPHDETNFQNYIKRMVGRYYMESREDFKNQREEIRYRHLSPHKEKHLIDKLMKNLPPVIDFDAIVIPDYYKPIGLIAPAIAFEDIILTRDKEELEKIKKATGRKKLHPVRLLGGSGWNNPKTVQRGQKFVEGSIFVDGFYLDNPNRRTRDFVAAFEEQTQKEPGLPDAQAYDVGGILGKLIMNQQANARKSLQQALIKMPAYKGVTGKITFDEDGEGNRKLFIFTIDKKKIRLLRKKDYKEELKS